jgi:hypothetical protein
MQAYSRVDNCCSKPNYVRVGKYIHCVYLYECLLGVLCGIYRFSLTFYSAALKKP